VKVERREKNAQAHGRRQRGTASNFEVFEMPEGRGVEARVRNRREELGQRLGEGFVRFRKKMVKTRVEKERAAVSHQRRNIIKKDFLLATTGRPGVEVESRRK
jgi:hypothetical protein